MTSNGTVTANINAQVYAAFKDSGVTTSLVAVFGCKTFVCLIGVLLNLDLILITARTKTLRGVCNLLIASSALSITVQNFSCFITFFVIISGANFIPLKICGFLQFFPLFFACFTNVIAFTIGLDRLLSILFPVWHISLSNKQNRIYFLLNICACSLYSGFVPIVGLWTSLNNPIVPVMCTVIDPVQSGASWNRILQLVTNSMCVICYLLVWAVIWMKKSSNTIKKKQLNIFKSLSTILLLEIGGWFTNYILRIFLADQPYFSAWYILQTATIVPYLTISISPAGLYMFSSEYRRAFLLHLPHFLKANPNTVHAISMNTNTNHPVILFAKNARNPSNFPVSETQQNTRK